MSILVKEEFDFLRKHSLTIETRERDTGRSNGLSRYYSSFNPIVYVEKSFNRISALGNGNTKESSINDLLSKISNKNVYINPSYSTRSTKVGTLVYNPHNASDKEEV